MHSNNRKAFSKHGWKQNHCCDCSSLIATFHVWGRNVIGMALEDPLSTNQEEDFHITLTQQYIHLLVNFERLQ